jgi:lipopolysaccharide transport system permease protein
MGLSIALAAALIVKPTWHLVSGALAAVASLTFLAIAAFALGLLVASLAVRRRDLNQALPILLQFGLYATPVGYPPSAMPQRYRWILDVNPVATAVTFFRHTLLGGDGPTPVQFLDAAVIVAALVIISLEVFRRVEPRMADVL